VGTAGGNLFQVSFHPLLRNLIYDAAIFSTSSITITVTVEIFGTAAVFRIVVSYIYRRARTGCGVTAGSKSHQAQAILFPFYHYTERRPAAGRAPIFNSSGNINIHCSQPGIDAF
jgi:hypothetical protein